MYSSLYFLTTALFIMSVAAYAYFCIKLSQDINAGRITVRAETEKS